MPPLVEIEYKAWWEIKKLNLDLGKAKLKRFLDLNELEELRNDAYLNLRNMKEKSKKWHDKTIAQKIFHQGDQDFLYDSKLHIFPGKLKSRWIGLFIIHQVYPNGTVEIKSLKDNQTFKVNGHRLKPYAVPFTTDKEDLTLLEPQNS